MRQSDRQTGIHAYTHARNRYTIRQTCVQIVTHTDLLESIFRRVLVVIIALLDRRNTLSSLSLNSLWESKQKKKKTKSKKEKVKKRKSQKKEKSKKGKDKKRKRLLSMGLLVG